jgi:hypothetical protein
MKDGELMEKEEVKTTETPVDDNTNAQIPTDKPVMPVQDEVRLFGRHIIYADYEPEEMNEQTISQILNDVFSVHLQNSREINYLENYYKGFHQF